MEGDAGASRLNPATVADEVEPIEPDAVAEPVRGSSRLALRGAMVGICAMLLLLSAAVVTGGYLALRSHQESSALAGAESAAVAAAKDCVAATQAPDIAAMSASQRKIIDCSTGAFLTQATLYTGILVDAYQAAGAQVRVTDMRAAAERHNGDGSVDVLVVVRVKLSNSQAQDQEQGYRLRVQMLPVDGAYKIAKLDQVTK